MYVVELGPSDAPELTVLYEAYDWWADREEAAVARALRNTPLALGVRDDADDSLVAAARVLTDYTYYARIYDVVVREERRDEGAGQTLMASVLDHPALADVNPVLICREGVVGFYDSVGFEPYPESVPIPEGGEGRLTQLIYARGE